MNDIELAAELKKWFQNTKWNRFSGFLKENPVAKVIKEELTKYGNWKRKPNEFKLKEQRKTHKGNIVEYIKTIYEKGENGGEIILVSLNGESKKVPVDIYRKWSIVIPEKKVNQTD